MAKSQIPNSSKTTPNAIQHNVLELAGALYRKMKLMGLELRMGNGRDDTLLEKLCVRLGCPDQWLQKYLNRSGMTAESFLVEFLSVVHPFSSMSREIWEYMSAAVAPKSKTGIAVRFSIKHNGKKTDIDLEQFRRWGEFQELFNQVIEDWLNALHYLFDMSRLLVPDIKKYESFVPLDQISSRAKLPELKLSKHPVDEVVARIYAIFEFAIHSVLEESDRAEKLIDRLHNLWPIWYVIFAELSRLNPSDKDKALAFFEEFIKPHLGKTSMIANGLFKRALDILDLPFWKHRWQTYEIWCTISVLKALTKFSPQICTDDEGRIPFDDSAGAIVATLSVAQFPKACVALQIQTEVKGFRDRKGMKPDLRICFSDEIRNPQSTAAIVEYKQRKFGDIKSHLLETFNLYAHGSPSAGGVIIVNYDMPKVRLIIPPQCVYIDSLTPVNEDKLQRMSTSLVKILRNAKLLVVEKVVLLDLSGSMASLYNDPEVRQRLQRFKRDPSIRLMGFSEHLYDHVFFDEQDLPMTYAGTRINSALQELSSRPFEVEKVLIVTDKEFDEEIDQTILNDASFYIVTSDQLCQYETF